MTFKFKTETCTADRRVRRSPPSSVLTSVMCAFAFSFCCTFSSTNAGAVEKKITAVTIHNISKEEQNNYLSTLRDQSQEAITQFLRGLHLTDDQIATEIEAVDVEFLSGGCLDQNTLFGIYKAVRGACTTITDDEFNFISSIILAQFNKKNDPTEVLTDFFPYGLNRLKAFNAPQNNVLEYVQNYPTIGDREKFDTLIVLGFLNLYWDHVKDKTKLSETELSILYSGFGQYGEKLRNLCPTFGSNQQSRCLNIAQEASQTSLLAKAKQP